MDTKEVVDKYFETVNAGDWDTWLTLFDDNVVMDEQLAGHWDTWLTLFDDNVVMDEQLAGRIEGVETLKGGIAGLKKGYSKFQNHPLHVVVQGNEASVVWHIEAANASGVPIDAKGTNYFQMKDGKISYMANFHDTVPFDPFVNQKLD